MEQEGYLGEFLIFSGASDLSNTSANKENIPTSKQLQPEETQEFFANWTTNQTKVLLDTYKKYRSKVGTFEIRNFKKLWEVIATIINDIFKTKYNSSHVENRWRVVERAYKKFVDNQNKTGRGKKYFEYQAEMDEIFKGKKNVKPEVLLSTDTVDCSASSPSTSTAASTVAETPVKSSSVKRRNPLISRNATIEQIRRDKKEYYREKLEIEREKLELQKQKILIMKERNELLKERNELLKNKSSSKDFL